MNLNYQTPFPKINKYSKIPLIINCRYNNGVGSFLEFSKVMISGLGRPNLQGGKLPLVCG
jgi:hypothetical protein